MPHAPAVIRSAHDDASLADVALDFAELRPRLLGIVSRVLGSWTEAEDIVQDAWLRWQTYDRSTVLNPTAFLVTTTTRLAINEAQSARVRRESYVGQWQSEPIDPDVDPATGAEQTDALGQGILVLLQHLSPTERAAYVLRHAFDYPYPHIAGVLQLSEANARQLVSRATKHLAGGRHRRASRAEHQRLVRAFVAAARRGDMSPLEDLLTGDVSSIARIDRRRRRTRPAARSERHRRPRVRHRRDVADRTAALS